MKENLDNELSRPYLPVPTDLKLVLVWTLFTLLSVTLPPLSTSPVRPLVASVFLVFVPGYVFLTVLFPAEGQIDLLERLVFSVGASLVLTGLVGIPLNLTPWGIRLLSLLVVHSSIVTVLTFLSWWRRSRSPHPVDTYAEVKNYVLGLLDDQRERPVDTVHIVLAAAVVLSVLAVGYTLATPLPSETYTEFYVLGPNQTVESLPENTTQSQSAVVMLGIHNREHAEKMYSIKVQKTGRRTEVIETINGIRLAHGENWTKNITVNTTSAGEPVWVDFLLFHGEAPEGVVSPDQAYADTRVWFMHGNNS